MDKVDNIQEQMDNANRDGNTKENQKILEIKNIVTEVKNAFNGLISRLEIAEENLALKDMTKETSEIVKQREKKMEKIQYPRTVKQLQKCNICVMGIPGEERREQKHYLQ